MAGVSLATVILSIGVLVVFLAHKAKYYSLVLVGVCAMCAAIAITVFSLQKGLYNPPSVGGTLSLPMVLVHTLLFGLKLEGAFWLLAIAHKHNTAIHRCGRILSVTLLMWYVYATTSHFLFCTTITKVEWELYNHSLMDYIIFLIFE